MAEKPTKSLTLTKPDGSQVNIDYLLLRRAVLSLRALNHHLRRRLLELIDSKKRIVVTDVYKKLRIEQSVASQHLAIMRRAQILTTEREGKFIWYSVNHKRIEEINALMAELAQPEPVKRKKK